MADLYTDAPAPRGQRSTPKTPKIDHGDLAFRFELAALDRRLRADRTLKAVTNFRIQGLHNMQLERLMKVVARAHSDTERATFLETVADDFRMRAYQERTAPHAA